jgi:hypothetical protein
MGLSTGVEGHIAWSSRCGYCSFFLLSGFGKFSVPRF